MFNGSTIVVDLTSMKFADKVKIRRVIVDNGGQMAFTVSKEVIGICVLFNDLINVCVILSSL
jgi:hypothetical protein